MRIVMRLRVHGGLHAEQLLHHLVDALVPQPRALGQRLLEDVIDRQRRCRG